MPGDLERRALAAASAVAVAHGVATAGAAVIHAGSNVLVHLRPAPLVVRVMTGTVPLHADPARWLRREVAVLAHLAPTGLAVAPSPLLAPGPHHHGGLWMTAAAWMPDTGPTSGRDDPRDAARRLRALHDALASFDGDLDGVAELFGRVERLHGLLRPGDGGQAAVDELAARLAEAREGVLAAALPVQALHGDVSLNNQLWPPTGPVWNDFEDTFRGPVHWDVAGLVISLRRRGADARGVRAALDAYGWGDAVELEPFLDAHAAYDDIWAAYDRHRRRGDL